MYWAVLISIICAIIFLSKQCSHTHHTPETISIIPKMSDEFQLQPEHSSWPAHIATDPQGYVYVVGKSIGSNGTYWIVRRKKPEGDQWETVDQFQYSPDQDSQAIKVYYDESLKPAIFVEGQVKSVDGKTHFLNRSTTNRGALWKTVWDDLNLLLTTYPMANNEFDFNNKENYIVGEEDDVNKNSVWFVKKKAFSSQEWIDVDRFFITPSHRSIARAILIGPSEKNTATLWVGGIARDDKNHSHWIVRVSFDRGNTWKTVDDYSGDIGADLVSGVLIKNTSYWIGNEELSDHSFRWIVRSIPFH